MPPNRRPAFKSRHETQAYDFRSFMPEDIMARWKPEIHAAESSDDSAINIYDIVGQDYWTGLGMTAVKVADVLKKNKGKEVTVNINSPGGDFFEGLAIYNLLKEHDGDIVVRVVGMAASAASVVAMAGDTIKIAEAGFIMIHNAWNCVCGNRNDMRAMAEVLEKFDATMGALYSKKTGMKKTEIESMMDDETWINGPDAVEQGFATQLLDTDELAVAADQKTKFNSSLKEIDMILAKAGEPRGKRRALLKDLTGTPGAAVEDATPRAGNPELVAALAAFNQTLKP